MPMRKPPANPAATYVFSTAKALTWNKTQLLNLFLSITQTLTEESHIMSYYDGFSYKGVYKVSAIIK